MIEQLSEGDALLEKIGDMFASNAVHIEAVKAYTKVGFFYTETADYIQAISGRKSKFSHRFVYSTQQMGCGY